MKKFLLGTVYSKFSVITNLHVDYMDSISCKKMK